MNVSLTNASRETTQRPGARPLGIPTATAIGLDEDPGFYYRCVIPFRGLHRQGLAVALPPVVGQGGADSDVTVVHRSGALQALVEGGLRLNRRSLVVVDDDDDIFNMTMGELLPKDPTTGFVEHRPMQEMRARRWHSPHAISGPYPKRLLRRSGSAL
jgi:hypothetical protein